MRISASNILRNHVANLRRIIRRIFRLPVARVLVLKLAFPKLSPKPAAPGGAKASVTEGRSGFGSIQPRAAILVLIADNPEEVVQRHHGAFTRSWPHCYSIAPKVSRAIRERALICFFRANPSAVNSPCLRAFRLPRGAPPPAPCIRQTLWSRTAGDRQGFPLRFDLAWHRNAWCISNKRGRSATKAFHFRFTDVTASDRKSSYMANAPLVRPGRPAAW
jgi:hypothetical protein